MGGRRGTAPPVLAAAIQLDEDVVPVLGLRLCAKLAAEEVAKDHVPVPETRQGSSPRHRALELQPHDMVALDGTALHLR